MRSPRGQVCEARIRAGVKDDEAVSKIVACVADRFRLVLNGSLIVEVFPHIRRIDFVGEAVDYEDFLESCLNAEK